MAATSPLFCLHLYREAVACLALCHVGRRNFGCCPGTGIDYACGTSLAQTAMLLLTAAVAPAAALIALVSGTSLAFLAILGGLAAHVGGASVTVGAMRVTFWGALAMGLTAGVGALFGVVA